MWAPKNLNYDTLNNGCKRQIYRLVCTKFSTISNSICTGRKNPPTNDVKNAKQPRSEWLWIEFYFRSGTGFRPFFFSQYTMNHPYTGLINTGKKPTLELGPEKWERHRLGGLSIKKFD